LLDEADRVDRVDEFGRRAVHDRHFRPVDLHERVIDVKTGERRHQMLDSRYGRAGRIAEHRAKRGLRHIRPLGLDQALAPVRQPRAQDHNSGIDVGGMKNDTGGSGRMNPEAVNLNAVAQRRLVAQFHLSTVPNSVPDA
jgi:hypothetical protein